MRKLWDSKKAKMALLAAMVAAVATYGGWTIEAVLAVVSPLLVYIGAQGLVDKAKASKW